MLKVTSAVKRDTIIAVSDYLKLCFIRNVPCARRCLHLNHNVRRPSAAHVAKAYDSPLLGKFDRSSFVSVRTKSNSNDIGNEGEESQTGEQSLEDVNFLRPIHKGKLTFLLNTFSSNPMLHELEEEYGIDSQMARKIMAGFKNFCLDTEVLPQDLHIVILDIIENAGHVDDLFPFYLRHARTMYQELECMEDLKKISDLSDPTAWYPEARSKQRKVIYHAGPTNSGKTHHALQRFLTAKSGVYCGPLRLLAVENFKKANASGTPCDLITGEERKYVDESGEPANHQACTVEMTNLSQPYEVAIIDEIQMLRDQQRGWAFTRAFLGVCADEVHLCGEEAGVDLIRDLTVATGDTFEVRRYKRLTKLKVLRKGIDNFKNVRPGDCIVCFSKNDIYMVTRQLEEMGIETAVIYGTLPPGTKLAQAEKFNNPDHPCKVLVATDAVGMGLNLSIKRMIFYSLTKPLWNGDARMEISLIPAPSALQIAGRAGRFNTRFSEGEVTTFKTRDLPLLKNLLDSDVESIKRAGLAPTAEQVESFAFHLPKKTLTELIDMFVRICNVDDSKYFMCHTGDFKFLASLIQHVPLDIKVRYVFCCAPISKKQPFACSVFLKFARQFSKGTPLTLDWVLCRLGHPFQAPRTIKELELLENIFDVMDLYLWLSYRFPNMFPDVEQMREEQRDLDDIIQSGVKNIMGLLANETSIFTDHSTTIIESEGQGLTPTQRELTDLDRAVTKPGQKISDQLVQLGLVTPDLLQKLKDEVVLKMERAKRRVDQGGDSKERREKKRTKNNKE